LSAIKQAKQAGYLTVQDEIEQLVALSDLAGSLAENGVINGRFQAFADSSKKIIL
jgi:hypothetical protein